MSPKKSNDDNYKKINIDGTDEDNFKNDDKQEQTPLIKQYFSIVNKYPGAIVIMRVGDFYETYGDIAVETSKLLGITLTKRSSKSKSSPSYNLPLSGFPYHSLDSYLAKLIQYGYKVAICDQLEDPSKAKGLVKRGVTELVTPGLVTQDSVLNNKRNNYLASLYFEENKCGISFLDFSTGEFSTTQGDIFYIQKLLDSFSPNEIIFSKTQEKSINNFLNIKQLIVDKRKLNSGLQDWIFRESYAIELLTNHFGSINMKGLGLEDMKLAIIASGAILQYLKDTGHENIDHITSISRIEQDKYMWLDKFTIKNLELVNPQHENGTALIDIIDETVTPMGGRMLKKWIILPLKVLNDIKYRQNFVTIFYNNECSTNKILNELKNIIDLERIIGKISVKKAVPKDLIALCNSLICIKNIKNILENILPVNGYIIYDCKEVIDNITKTISEDPTQNEFIKYGINKELDECKNIRSNGNTQLRKFLEEEVRKTGINTLKIGYNKIYGYYFEVSNSHKDKIPSSWTRKQTLTTGERYTNDELKIFEEKILNADSKITEIENAIFNQLNEFILKYTKYILHNAEIIAKIDCYICLSYIAKKYKYCCPNINNEYKIDIKNGRHPVIERKMSINEYYVPNDIYLDNTTQQIMLITGPNMAGKSALLRETALIVLMSQIGSYVPASTADICIIDKIFTRVGATDNISTGESTFMMEMSETANIMHNLSERSLIIMDEIGRGTSTYDGISIAWAILEYLHNSKFRPKTLFATHYHELSDLENILERLFNFSLSVLEKENKIIFIRKLEKKKSEHSFGINVAKLSGMPIDIINRAKEILNNLEKYSIKIKDSNKIKFSKIKNVEKESNDFIKLKKIIDDIDPNKLSPLEALAQLYEIKKIL